MSIKSDSLEKYVVRLAKVLLVLGVLLMPLLILARLPAYEMSHEVPKFIKDGFFIYYVVGGILSSILSILLYPIGFLYLRVFILCGIFSLRPKASGI